MELPVDKSGRVTLPKEIREHLGVGLGIKVEVKETPEGILLKPVRRPSNLIRKNGILVFGGSGEDSSHINWDKLVEEDREERIRKIAKL